MVVDKFKADKFSLIPRLFRLVNDLSEEQQLTVLRQLLEDNVKPYLFKSIIDLTEKQQIQLLEKLETAPLAKAPIKTLSLDDDQATMREHLRKSCYIDARISIGNRHHQAIISDISTVGVFIEVGEPFAKGQQLDVSFNLPNSTEPLRLSGIVVWIGQGGVGVRLGRLTAEEERIIRTYIQSTNQADL